MLKGPIGKKSQVYIVNRLNLVRIGKFSNFSKIHGSILWIFYVCIEKGIQINTTTIRRLNLNLLDFMDLLSLFLKSRVTEFIYLALKYLQLGQSRVIQRMWNTPNMQR